MSAIALEGLGKRYGDVAAVDGVDLLIASGEFVTLLGPSGSGKTTTLRMIAGLEQPTAGAIRIGDRVVSGPGVFVPVHERRLGMVFQSYAVWPHMSVRDNVAFPLEQAGVSRAERGPRAEAMLQLVGLAGYADRYPSQLSGGQQQRVALARALVGEPDVILFDEPLSNLDAQLRDSMRTLIRDLHRRLRITAVYVTHDQAEALQLSDRIFIMHDGRLAQCGSPEALYERPADRFVAEFLGAANVLPLQSFDAAAGRAKLASGATLRVAAATDAAPAASPTVLVVRPHRVRVAPDGANENVFAARVASVVYLGDRLRVVANADGIGALEMELAPEARPRPREGDALSIVLPPDACLPL